MYEFQSMLCQSRDGVFASWFNIKEKLSERDLLKLFVLINKHYPSYYFKSDDYISNQKKKWEEYILSDFTFRPDTFNNIYLSVNIIVQDHEGQLLEIYPKDDCLEIIYGTDDGDPVFGIQVYPYVFFDKNYVYTSADLTGGEKTKRIDVNQAQAARKNRAILKAFLKEVELLLNAEITDFEAGRRLSKDHVYKYGIKEDAVLSYDQEA